MVDIAKCVRCRIICKSQYDVPDNHDHGRNRIAQAQASDLRKMSRTVTHQPATRTIISECAHCAMDLPRYRKHKTDRKRDVQEKSGSGSEDLGGRRYIKK